MHSDSDWAGDLDDIRSTSGYIFMLCGAWRSKKQTSVALSTALSGAVQGLRQFTLELSSGDVPTKATVIHEYDQSAISLAKNLGLVVSVV